MKARMILLGGVCALRSTSRAFATDELPAQTLSNLLWPAWGINRPKEGKRTARSASNWQQTDISVVMSTGAYIYDALQKLEASRKW